MVRVREIVTPARLAEKVAEVGRQIALEHPDGELVLVGMLKGAAVFLSDLVRTIERPVRFEFVDVTRKTVTGGEAVALTYATHIDIAGVHTLILKDICHSGVTENYLITHLSQQDPASIGVVALVDRPWLRRVELEPRHVVLRDLPDARLVGYGMEYQGRWGNLRGINELEGE